MTVEYTKKGSIYQHESLEFRIRERKGRAYEVEFAERPSLWISTGTRDFDEADRFVKNRLHSEHRFLPNESVTLEDFVGKKFFLEEGQGSIRERYKLFGKNYDETYYKSKQGLLKNYILPTFGKWSLKKIANSSTFIEDWYIGITNFRHPGQPISPAQKLCILDAFSIILREAERKGLIDKNPCESVQRMSVNKESKREIFTKEEIAELFPNDYERLMDLWDGSLMWALYFSIMVDTGWRPGEVAGLSSEHVDEEGKIYTKDNVSGATRKLRHRIKTTGKGKGTKYGLLSSYTMDLYEKYEETIEGTALFIDDKGKYVSLAQANRILRKVCEKAGIDLRERTQYCFRHTFNTYMLANLGPLLEESDVRDLMAHTGYRPEYDHRTPEQILFKLGKVRPAIEKMRIAQ